jgi:hypothetical protein
MTRTVKYVIVDDEEKAENGIQILSKCERVDVRG